MIEYGGLFFMRRYYIEQKLKSAAAFLIILILLPYIVSVFVSGTGVRADRKEEETYVQVKTEDARGEIQTEELGWTEYLVGILAEDLPRDTEHEAVKAQAVLVRTSLYQTLSKEDKTLESDYLTRMEMQEKWGLSDYQEIYDSYVQAVEETDNLVLWYGDGYPWVPFHQSSNGMTRSAEEVTGSKDYPYIAAKECPLDKEAEDEIQVFSFGYSEIQEKCRDFLVAAEGEDEARQGYSFEDFEIQSRDSSGYVQKLRIGKTVCTGDQFRDALSLPSSDFSFSEDGNKMKITTSGKGHGLGMSLWTANEMAKEGKTCEEILNFFFEGTSLKNDEQESDLI